MDENTKKTCLFNQTDYSWKVSRVQVAKVFLLKLQEGKEEKNQSWKQGYRCVGGWVHKNMNIEKAHISKEKFITLPITRSSVNHFTTSNHIVKHSNKLREWSTLVSCFLGRQVSFKQYFGVRDQAWPLR